MLASTCLQTGPPGETGNKGPEGSRGQSGKEGKAGQPGPRGMQGDMGVPGLPGAQGPAVRCFTFSGLTKCLDWHVAHRHRSVFIQGKSATDTHIKQVCMRVMQGRCLSLPHQTHLVFYFLPFTSAMMNPNSYKSLITCKRSI